LPEDAQDLQTRPDLAPHTLKLLRRHQSQVVVSRSEVEVWIQTSTVGNHLC